MANVKDLQTKVEYTTDNPFDNNSPTWTEIPAIRLDEDSEGPTDEVEDAGLMDGRTGAGGHALTATYAIRKDDATPDAVIDGLVSAEGDTPVWFRETDLQANTTPQVIGGPLGCIIQVGEDSQGFGGHRVFPVQASATAAEANVLIQDDPNAGS